MPRQKGTPKTGGRQAGTPNRVTASIRQAFQEAFDRLQSDDEACLDAWAKKNLTEFYKLSSKLIPLDVAVQGGLTLNVVSGLPECEADDGSDLV
jgi:hypothetical protein